MQKRVYALVAILSCAASPAFAADCDRYEFAVHQFEEDMGGAECEFIQEQHGQKWWNCRVPNLNELYYKFFAEDSPQWPYALTQANVCFSDGSLCQIWYQGHCTCDECEIEWTAP